jgi:glutamine synthetase
MSKKIISTKSKSPSKTTSSQPSTKIAAQVATFLKEAEAHYVDLRFTDLKGKEHHVTVPSHTLDEGFFQDGKMFDGSSIAGWKAINKSDMILMPDPSTLMMDPFYEENTAILRCNVVDPQTLENYDRDPRSVAARAEAYLKTTGIADTAYFGPEPEFFIFDEVRWDTQMHSTSFSINSQEGSWNNNTTYPDGNTGHRPGLKGGYFPVPPVDSSQDIRTVMTETLRKMGLVIEAHHHEVATANQNEIATKFNTLVKKADEVQILKYVVQNVAHAYGKTATFMPKPLVGDNGSGMHCHQSLSKNGENIFAGDAYEGLSMEALYYIGGIIKHARALNAFTNATTNSYKRLVPGFEAPVMLAYSARNRSASIRIPYVTHAKGRRIEVRFPDAASNPYFAFSAMMMAGLDGIANKIHPGESHEEDLYEISAKEAKKIPQVCYSLDQALEALDKDRGFLTAGDVFSNDLIDAYIKLKMTEVTRLRMSTHPVEFDLYYSL